MHAPRVNTRADLGVYAETNSPVQCLLSERSMYSAHMHGLTPLDALRTDTFGRAHNPKGKRGVCAGCRAGTGSPRRSRIRRTLRPTGLASSDNCDTAASFQNVCC